MDIGNFLASISLIAILALVGTVLVLAYELRHVFFHKKVTANPEIPDFDGNIHAAPEHATLIDIDSIEQGGINKTLVFVLLAIVVILIIVVIAGFMYSSKKPTSPKPAVQVPTTMPTQIIDIVQVSPTSPFKEVVEIPFDLSGTPTQITITSALKLTTTSGMITLSTTPTSSNLTATQSAQATTVIANPSLPASGGYSQLILLSIVPFLLIALAIIF